MAKAKSVRTGTQGPLNSKGIDNKQTKVVRPAKGMKGASSSVAKKGGSR